MPLKRLIGSEQHLRLVTCEYVYHFSSHRPHRALQQNRPQAGRDPLAEIPASDRTPPAELDQLLAEARIHYQDSVHEQNQVRMPPRTHMTML